MHTKFGELAVAKDFIVTETQALDREMRCKMIEGDHPALSVGAQCRLLSISRSSFYYAPKSEPESNLALKAGIGRWINFNNYQAASRRPWQAVA